MRGYLAFPNLLDHRIPQRTCIIWSTFWEIQEKKKNKKGKEILRLQVIYPIVTSKDEIIAWCVILN